jgi:serine/threonine protein kinase
MRFWVVRRVRRHCKKVYPLLAPVKISRRQTVCGTYEYMAPEVLNKKNQSTKIDIWALGILLYELVHGFAPFPGKSMASVENKIFQGRIKFDPNLSKESQALVKKILRINPENRPVITEILEDPWVKMFGDHKNPTKNVGPLNSEIMGFNGRGEPAWG